MIARFLFVLMPAVFVGLLVLLAFDTKVGALIAAVGMIGFGLDMTKLHPERGERL